MQMAEELFITVQSCLHLLWDVRTIHNLLYTTVTIFLYYHAPLTADEGKTVTDYGSFSVINCE